MSGNFLSCSKGVKDPLEVPEFKCDYPLLASAEMGVISSGGENLLDFLELRQVLSTYEGASGKAIPHASCSGPSWDSCPIDAGA